MSQSQTVCIPESLSQSGSSYTGEQAWTHTGRSEREREDKYMTDRERGKHMIKHKRNKGKKNSASEEWLREQDLLNKC